MLPGKTPWEQMNYQNAGGQSILIPEIVEAPGKSLDTWDFTIAFLRAYEKARPELAGLADQYTGHDNVPGNNNTPIPGDRLINKF